MNRTDRLLAILLELQGKGRQRAEDLAATFEVSKRTIYRDIDALSQAGVPIVSVPGQGYSLVKGYFLPPLSFSTEEAIVLLLGSEVMAQSFDAQYQAAAQSAGRKIAGVLRERLRNEVEYLRANIRFMPRAVDLRGGATRAREAALQQIRRAIIDRQVVRFTYHRRFSRASSGDQPGDGSSVRDVDPHGLVHTAGSWYMVGYDSARQGMRMFRLDRMEDLVVLDRSFARHPDFKLEEPEQTDRDIEVRLLFDKDVARWIQESPPYYMVGEKETERGLLVTLRIRQETDVLPWLLGWGGHVRVLEPDSIRRLLVEEARRVLSKHQNP